MQHNTNSRLPHIYFGSGFAIRKWSITINLSSVDLTTWLIYGNSVNSRDGQRHQQYRCGFHSRPLSAEIFSQPWYVNVMRGSKYTRMELWLSPITGLTLPGSSYDITETDKQILNIWHVICYGICQRNEQLAWFILYECRLLLWFDGLHWKRIQRRVFNISCNLLFFRKLYIQLQNDLSTLSSPRERRYLNLHIRLPQQWIPRLATVSSSSLNFIPLGLIILIPPAYQVYLRG